MLDFELEPQPSREDAHLHGRVSPLWMATELPPAIPTTTAAVERVKMERGARGTDSSPHLGQGRRGERDRRRWSERREAGKL
jgi:hypothetical protein